MTGEYPHSSAYPNSGGMHRRNLANAVGTQENVVQKRRGLSKRKTKLHPFLEKLMVWDSDMMGMACALVVMIITMICMLHSQSKVVGYHTINRPKAMLGSINNFRARLKDHINADIDNGETDHDTDMLKHIGDGKYAVFKGFANDPDNVSAHNPFQLHTHKTDSRLFMIKTAKCKTCAFSTNYGAYPFDFTYHGKDEKVCLTMHMKGHNKRSFQAEFEVNCQELHRWVLRYMTYSRYATIPVNDFQHVSLPEGVTKHGLNYQSETPAHIRWQYFEKNSGDYPSDENVKARHLIYNPELIEQENGEFYLVADMFYKNKLVPFNLAWPLKRSIRIFHRSLQYLNHTDRAYGLKKLVLREGEDASNVNWDNAMSVSGYRFVTEIKDKIPKNAIQKMDKVDLERTTPRPYHVAGAKIVDELNNVLFEVDSNTKVEYMPDNEACLKLEVGTEATKEYFFAWENCDLIYLDIQFRLNPNYQ